MGVFQYMIGNTDFSSRTHNVELFFTPEGNVLPVAFDFDFAGAVNALTQSGCEAEHRERPPTRISRLLQRSGFLRQGLRAFKEKKPEIYALYRRRDRTVDGQGTVKETLRYFDEFSETINDPRSANDR